jgi:hypothetical protein
MRRGKASPKTSRAKTRKSRTRLSDVPLVEGEHLTPVTIQNRTNHRISQSIATYQILQIAGSPAFGTIYFNVNQLDQLTSFQALFDQYRFDSVDVTFMPQFRANPLAGATVNIPLIYVTVDYDDNTVLTTLNQIRQYDNCIIRDDEHAFTVHITPHYNNVTENSGRNNRPADWIDMADAVNHYGVKWAIGQGDAGQALQGWSVSIRYNMSFKNVR